MRRPAFQFYPADWRKDVELQSCSMAAQGLWINLMCVAHECDPYGHLTVNGKPMTHAQVGRQVGLSAKECGCLLDELLEAGVARKTEEGAIYSKRMVEDERIRNARSEGGKGGAEHGAKGGEHGFKGGRPKKDKGGLKTPLPNDKEPPPSSSSTSSSNSEAIASGGKPPADFAKAELWRAAVSLLQSQGLPEPQARSLFGKLAKDFPDGDIVLHAVQAAVAEQPADARGYLVATCKTLAGQRAKPMKALESFAERDRIAAMTRWEEMTGRDHPDLATLRAQGAIPLRVVSDAQPIETIAYEPANQSH